MSTLYDSYRAAVAGRPLPLALVDLDALEANVDALSRTLAGRKPMRVATKSIRSTELVRRIVDRLGDAAGGLMTYTAQESALLHAQGFGNLLLAYPTVQPSDTACLARLNREGARAAVVVDCAAHVDALDAAAREAGTRAPVVLEIDLSLRPVRSLHLGVRRSPLSKVEEAVELARRIAARRHVAFAGVMGYEAQIAGVPDHGPGSAAGVLAMKAVSRRRVADKRRELRLALEAVGLAPPLFNGGGTGSLAWSAHDDALTEVTVGSGFLDSHLFDGYRDLSLRPAAFFALQVVRKPSPGIVTCHGGGYVASGKAGVSRLPVPALPEGLSLTRLEGAGEVQTPLRLPPDVDLVPGDPVFFRHAKAGELAEHFNEYLLVRGGRIEASAKTYRGLGHAFLG